MPSSKYDRELFAAQAERIETLGLFLAAERQANVRLHDQIAHMKPAAEFYELLQDAVLGTPALHGEWRKFIAMLKLFLPEDVPGLTSPRSGRPTIATGDWL